MKTDRIALRRQLLVFLYNACPDLVCALKESRHVYPGQLSPYHLEDSVWTHTLLALQAALDREDFTIEDILCALVHDFAKPASAAVIRKSDGTKKISFARHGPMGAQAAVDFLAALCRHMPGLIDADGIARIAAAVSGHIEFYDLRDAEEALRYCSNDPALLRTLSRILYCDLQGSVLDPAQASYAANLALLEDIERRLSGPLERETAGPAEGPGLHLVCGQDTEAKRNLVERLAGGRLVVRGADGENASETAERVLEAVEGRPAALGEGVLVVRRLRTRRSRKALANVLADRLPGVPLTCTCALSPSPESWYPQMPSCSQRTGLPPAAGELVMPSLLFEPRLARVSIVFAAD
ncbi:MAG: hypothetical protein Q4F72_03725 [Desulfovibrionaceae bacterium]|nr:hypothetical protein [Desulfovibrionaceae bacterium]